MKFHLLSFESAREASTADKIVVFQKDGNCVKQKGNDNEFQNHTWKIAPVLQIKVHDYMMGITSHIPVRKQVKNISLNKLAHSSCWTLSRASWL